MTNNKLGLLTLMVVCLAALGTAGAQTMRHDKMDSRAARADIQRLKQIRKQDVRAGNWGKVAQDARLIAKDKHFVHSDKRKMGDGG